jgi:hypothetical protein
MGEGHAPPGNVTGFLLICFRYETGKVPCRGAFLFICFYYDTGNVPCRGPSFLVSARKEAKKPPQGALRANAPPWGSPAAPVGSFVGILCGLLLMVAKAGGGSVYFGFWGIGSGSFWWVSVGSTKKTIACGNRWRVLGNRFLVIFGEG